MADRHEDDEEWDENLEMTRRGNQIYLMWSGEKT